MTKRRFREVLSLGVVIILLSLFIGLVVDFVSFPEYYLPTWKQALESEIQNGDADAIEYYNRCYVANGRALFEE